jgi:CRP/FNR family transcriptional regulator, cyclic AMP receptor protein
LANVPLFRALDGPDLRGLEGLMRRRKYARDEVIFLRGDEGVNLCIVETGRVRLTLTSESQGREVTYTVMCPGDVFGELALLDGEPRSSDAIALEPSVLLLLGRDDFLRFLNKHPSAAITLLRDMGRRLRRDLQVIQDATFLDVAARVASVILRLAVPQADGSLCTPPITQSNLASMALTTRETLNQCLRSLAEQGLIRWDKDRVRILNKDLLERRVY